MWASLHHLGGLCGLTLVERKIKLLRFVAPDGEIYLILSSINVQSP
jgi:hypothetical protein